MNISLQKIMTQGTMQPQDRKAAPNSLYGISFDKAAFDSFMNNIKAEPAGKAAEQYDYRSAGNEEQYAPRANGINRREEPAESRGRIDDRKYHNSADEYSGRTEEADRPSDMDDVDYSNGSREVRGNNDQTENFAEEGDKISGTGTVVKKTEPGQADNGGTGLTERGAQRAQGLNTAGLLFAMANSRAGAINGEAGDAMNQGNSPADNTGNEKGVKTGALLFDLAKGVAETGKTAPAEGSIQTEAALKAENGLKAGVLLKELMKGNQTDTADLQNDGLNGRVNAESLNSDQTKSENGFKTGSLILDRANAQPGENVNDDPVDMRVKADIKEPAAAAKSDKELFDLAGKKTGAGQHAAKDLHVRAAINEADHIEENNIARTLAGKSMAALAENISSQAGTRNISENSPKAVRPVNGSSNALAGTTDVIQESGKMSKGLQTAQTARPSAFQEIADRIVYVVKGNNRIGVTIENESFGKMNIHVSMNRGQVNVHINTADSMAREFVESNINQIIDSLSKNGVSVGGFSVGLRNHRNNEGSENGNARGRREDINIGSRQKDEYIRAGRYLPANDGMVSVFA